MRVIRTARAMARAAATWRRRGRRIGFVPTMGALHQGHGSLIRAARWQTDVVVVSIFVNPLQFGPREDYARYPRPRRRDLQRAKAAGADIVFAPGVEEMYPEGSVVTVDVGPLGDRLEGAARPEHFRGVATIVMKLFALVQPTVAYFGQKDYQQAVIVRRLIEALRLPVTLRIMPTIREPDGVAMSSRNAYLTAAERRQATALYRALQLARRRIRAGERDPRALTLAMRRRMAGQPSVRVGYAAVVDASTLQPVRRLRGRMALLVAATVGATRLIDNLLVDVP